MLHANTLSTYIDFMKAPNALMIFFKVPKIVWEYFLIKFLPLCSSGDVWVHASIQLFYFMPKVLKSGNFIK